MSQFNAPIDTTIAARYYLQGAQLGTEQGNTFNETQRRALLDAQNQDFRKQQLAQDQLQYAGTQEFRGQELDFRNRQLELAQAKEAFDQQQKLAQAAFMQKALRTKVEFDNLRKLKAQAALSPVSGVPGAAPTAPGTLGFTPNLQPTTSDPSNGGQVDSESTLVPQSQPVHPAFAEPSFVTPAAAMLNPNNQHDIIKEALISGVDSPEAMKDVQKLLQDDQAFQNGLQDLQMLEKEGLANHIDPTTDGDLARLRDALARTGDPVALKEYHDALGSRIHERIDLNKKIDGAMRQPSISQKFTRSQLEGYAVNGQLDDLLGANAKSLAEQNTPEERDAKAQAIMRKYPRKFPDMQSAIDEIMLAGNKKDYQYIDKLPSGDTKDTEYSTRAKAAKERLKNKVEVTQHQWTTLANAVSAKTEDVAAAKAKYDAAVQEQDAALAAEAAGKNLVPRGKSDAPAIDQDSKAQLKQQVEQFKAANGRKPTPQEFDEMVKAMGGN
jgi:hypothetical protein